MECKDKCDNWQEDSWGESSYCQKCYDETRLLTAGPRMKKTDKASTKFLAALSIAEGSGMADPFEPPSPAEPHLESPSNSPDLSLTKTTTTMEEFIGASHASFSLPGYSSSSKQPEPRASSSKFRSGSSSHFAGSPLTKPVRSFNSFHIPSSSSCTLSINDYSADPFASISSEFKGKSKARAPNSRIEPLRSQAHEAPLSQQRPTSSSTSSISGYCANLFSTILSIPKGNSKAQAPNPRIKSPGSQAPKAPWSHQRPMTPPKTTKDSIESSSPAGFPQKPPSCFHVPGRWPSP